MVVVSGTRARKPTTPAGTLFEKMSARAVLTCRPNSHPFQERTLILDTPVKVGRSVARARPATDNAIFDCKVLSRHHALIWYENGKFFLQDTKSSNGTFVNNNRLSDGGKESSPREISSGDIVQFGVDVVENNRRVTHGCVIVTLKLYLPDGKEAKASHSIGAKTADFGNADELYRLAQHLRDAARREQQLEAKLGTLQRLVEQAKQAAELGWRAAVDEDRLLSRVAILESQLLAYTKTTGDGNIREELMKLQDDKTAYQNAAKESLQKLHKERLEALDKVTILERAAITCEEEREAATEQCRTAQEELRQLALQLADSQRLTNELTEKLAESKIEDTTLRTKVDELLERERILNLKLDALEGVTLNPNMLTSLKADLEQAQEQIVANEEKSIKNSEEDIYDLQDAQNDDEARLNCQRIQDKIDILERILPKEIFDKMVTQPCKDTDSVVTIKHDDDNDATLEKLHEQINTIEDRLKMEQEIKHQLELETEQLRQKLVDVEQVAKESKNEAQQLRDRLMAELDKSSKESTTRIEQSQHVTELELLINQLRSEKSSLETQLQQMVASASISTSSSSSTSELNDPLTACVEDVRIAALEEELVLIKEMHAQCIPERTKLQKEIENVKNELVQCVSRSQTVIFCYVAPLVLIIFYLLIQMFFA